MATGVEYAELNHNGSKVYAAKVDLCAPGVRMRATGPGEGPRTPSSYGQLVGASVAINGDWWSVDGEPHLPQTYPRGLGIGDGRHFEGTVDRPHYGVIAFGMNTVLHSPMGEDLGGPHFWMQDVVSGQPTLVWDGALRDNPANHCGVRRARTAMGFNEARDVMLMAVVQEVDGSQGMTCNQMGALMQSLGAHSALNHDGGGSSTMWLAGSGVVNRPTGGAERSLVNHWGVMAPGEGPPRSCTTRDIQPPDQGVRRHVASPEVMEAWHFEFGDVALMAEDTLSQYPEGEALTEGPRFVQHSDSSLWLVDEANGRATKRHVESFYAIQTWRMTRDPFETGADSELDALPEGPPVTETPVLVFGPDFSVWLIDSAPAVNGDDDDDEGGGSADAGGGGSGDAGVGGGGATDATTGGGCTAAGSGAPSSASMLLLAALFAMTTRRGIAPRDDRLRGSLRAQRRAARRQLPEAIRGRPVTWSPSSR